MGRDEQEIQAALGAAARFTPDIDWVNAPLVCLLSHVPSTPPPPKTPP